MTIESTLVLGGCRSGKSSHALALANAVGGSRKVFMATSVPTDAEMAARVDKHVKERGDTWHTAEIPRDVPEAIAEMGADSDVILVDCLTLWVTNLMMAGLSPDQVMQRAQDLARVIASPPCPVILVANEVGWGIVPKNVLARQFRDLAGFVNQRTAKAADRVTLVVAGIPMAVKGGIGPTR